MRIVATRLLIVCLVAVSANKSYAADANSICERAEIKAMHYDGCSVGSKKNALFYSTPDGASHTGRLAMAIVRKNGGIDGSTDFKYYLQKDDGSIIPLGRYFALEYGGLLRNERVSRCVEKQLGLDYKWSLSPEFFTIQYQIENDVLYTHYTGNYPFEGTVKIANDSEECSGDLKFSPDVFNWKKAEGICTTLHNYAMRGLKTGGGDNDPKAMKLHKDSSGIYYTCTHSTPVDFYHHYELWTYRLDAKKTAKITPTFLSKERKNSEGTMFPPALPAPSH